MACTLKEHQFSIEESRNENPKNNVEPKINLDVTRCELQALAIHHLRSFIYEEFFSYVTGIHCGSSHFAKEDKYIQLAELLSPLENQDVITALDGEFQRKWG